VARIDNCRYWALSAVMLTLPLSARDIKQNRVLERPSFNVARVAFSHQLASLTGFGSLTHRHAFPLRSRRPPNRPKRPKVSVRLFRHPRYLIGRSPRHCGQSARTYAQTLGEAGLETFRTPRLRGSCLFGLCSLKSLRRPELQLVDDRTTSL
jgi:hypothetical protein